MRRAYGSSLWHLLAHVATFALAGWALLAILDQPRATYAVIWLIGAVLLHDALLWPLYSVADRSLPRRARNYVRVPAGLSALLFVVYSPQILGLSDATYRRVSGLSFDRAVERWLLATAALFAASGVVYLIRRGSKA
jgi:hypothetical protein